MSKKVMTGFLKGSFTIKKLKFIAAICRHKYMLIAFAAAVSIETYLSFQFYSREPEFPTTIYTIDVFNIISRDLLLASLGFFLQKYIAQIKQAAKDHLPIAVASLLWLSISAIIIRSLNLNFNAKTVLSVLSGLINNILFVLLAGALHLHYKSRISKTIYFFSYFVTILFLYGDTIYFYVTSTHIQNVLFDNLNNCSITGILATTDKTALAGILLSFCFLILLFRAPRKTDYTPAKQIVIGTIAVCIIANFFDTATAYVYPKALLVHGYDEEAEIEKSRNLSRDILSASVPYNIVREYLRNEKSSVAALSQRQRWAFSEDEAQLLDELGIKVHDRPVYKQPFFPYEKVILLVAESFHRDYLHYYNPRIPAEASEFIDSLIARYPHLDNYYTANKPTTQGLNSIFLSQLIYSDEQAFDNNATLFKSMEKSGYSTVFLEATSQYYNDEFRAYKKRFGMQMYRAKEDLEREGYTGSTGWGFHNDVMYEETLKLLEQNRNQKMFIVTKTIDSHQPYPYCGFSDEDIPDSIKNQPDNLYLKAIYWENKSLQRFFHDLEEKKLLDDKTLIIITSDHNPHPSQSNYYKRLGQDDLRLTIAPIPLIFIGKNLQPFENLSSQNYASQIDLAPTLLGALGIPSPQEFSGRNLLNVDNESYALGCVGETVYYWSNDRQIETDMYTGKNQTPTEKALIHWVQDRYVKYFGNN